MKIAIVSDSIYPYNKGGKEKRLFEIATRLVKYGHEITIYTMKWWEGADSIKRKWLPARFSWQTKKFIF